MLTDTEGIIFRQVKTVNGRRMILLFSQKYGKISAGTNISETGKSKSSLAMRPFTYGRYELYKNRDNYHINGTDVIKSYYRIGEDVEKYMYCAYALEFTEKLLQEEAPAPKIFRMLLDFFDIMEKRSKKYFTLVLAYQIKVLQESGSMPQVNECVICGRYDEAVLFSIKDGGIICGNCRIKYPEKYNDTLIYEVDFGILNVLRYILDNTLNSFENLALDDRIQQHLRRIIKSHIAYHLDIGELKSESFLFDN
ncbi:MAG: DNA repair protein RecO [Eubacteriales bacterium]|nr:DNA repair protein RecO [Eubacteriales bacterium]MDD3199642.1 DNA repair protein RecO [Eubacteriales bacterium]MDD4629909.1 DNA repair protein RecO [Eubacteriales bacterium]